MDVIGRTKSLCLKVWSKIEDRLAGFAAGAIIIVFSSLCLTSWGWMKAKHQLDMFGWMWLIVLLVLIFSLVSFVWGAFNYFTRIRNSKDIRNVLSKWWRHCADQCPGQNEFTLYFSSIDKKERLKRGSAKKYLQEIIAKDGCWAVVREGEKTLTIRKKSTAFQWGPNGP